MPPKRMTANPNRPARYFPGKAVPAEASASESGSSDDEAEDDETQPKKPAPAPAPATFKATSFPKGAAQIASNLKTVSLNAQKSTAAQKPAVNEDDFETEESEEEGSEEDGEDSDEEEDSSEEESSSEDDDAAARRKLLRPVFIKKGQRAMATGSAKPEKTEDEIYAEQEARRKQAADELVQAQIEKDAAVRAASKKNWDDEDPALEEEIDDTDDLDPESEYAAWKLRELQRIRRDRAKIEEQEAELAERERRRNLTAEEREAEDMERLAKQKEERGDRGQMSFMQKYFHKGAFFQDDLAAAGLDKRNVMGARFADEGNKELLPEYMRIRDMTKLGKKGRTRYKDMKSEDTGRWGDLGYARKRDGDYRGVDERFRPDNDRDGERDGAGATGANASALGDRKRYGDEGDRNRDNKRPRVYDD